MISILISVLFYCLLKIFTFYIKKKYTELLIWYKRSWREIYLFFFQSNTRIVETKRETWTWRRERRRPVRPTQSHHCCICTGSRSHIPPWWAPVVCERYAMDSARCRRRLCDTSGSLYSGLSIEDAILDGKIRISSLKKSKTITIIQDLDRPGGYIRAVCLSDARLRHTSLFHSYLPSAATKKSNQLDMLSSWYMLMIRLEFKILTEHRPHLRRTRSTADFASQSWSALCPACPQAA